MCIGVQLCVATVGVQGWRVSLIGGFGEGDATSVRESCITTVCHTPVGRSSHGRTNFCGILDVLSYGITAIAKNCLHSLKFCIEC